MASRPWRAISFSECEFEKERASTWFFSTKGGYGLDRIKEEGLPKLVVISPSSTISFLSSPRLHMQHPTFEKHPAFSTTVKARKQLSRGSAEAHMFRQTFLSK